MNGKEVKNSTASVLARLRNIKPIGIAGARPTIDIHMLRKGKADQLSLWR